MKPLSRLVMIAAVCVGIATSAAGATPSDVLNRLEVQKLVALDTTVAKLRLALHFNDLAAQFMVDAERHRAMASVYRANANRSLARWVISIRSPSPAKVTGWSPTTSPPRNTLKPIAPGRRGAIPWR